MKLPKKNTLDYLLNAKKKFSDNEKLTPHEKILREIFKDPERKKRYLEEVSKIKTFDRRMNESIFEVKEICKSKNPERIDKILEAIKLEWKANPELRFSQLFLNITNPDNIRNLQDIFYLEDDELYAWIKNWKRRYE